MSLMDVRYNESGTFQLLVFFRNNGLKETQSDIHVSVTGRLYNNFSADWQPIGPPVREVLDSHPG